MEAFFYITGAVALISTLLVILQKNAVHALLYLIVSLLAVSMIFYILGAPFIAALEIIIYAGAIMVLFVFVIMVLNINEMETKIGSSFSEPRVWVGPAVIALILMGEILFMIFSQDFNPAVYHEIPPAELGKVVFTQYALMVDLAGFLLVAGILGAYHLGQKETKSYHRYLRDKNEES